MDCINLGILQQFIVVRVALLDVKLVGHLVHLLLVAAANRHEIDVGMGLVDRNELGSKAESNDGDIMDVFAHYGLME